MNRLNTKRRISPKPVRLDIPPSLQHAHVPLHKTKHETRLVEKSFLVMTTVQARKERLECFDPAPSLLARHAVAGSLVYDLDPLIKCRVAGYDADSVLVRVGYLERAECCEAIKPANGAKVNRWVGTADDLASVVDVEAIREMAPSTPVADGRHGARDPGDSLAEGFVSGYGSPIQICSFGETTLVF